MAPFSDSTWSIAQPSYQSMIQSLSELQLLIQKGELSSFDLSQGVNLTMSYQFSQQENIKVLFVFIFWIILQNNIQSTPNTVTYILVNSTNITEIYPIIGKLKDVVNCSGEPFKINKFYDSVIPKLFKMKLTKTLDHPFRNQSSTHKLSRRS